MDLQLRADLRSVARRLADAISLFGSLPRSEYRSIVGEVVAALASQRLPASDVYPKSLGAFPTVVKEALEKLSAAGRVGSRSRPVCDPALVPLDPVVDATPWEDDELDPVDAQWYFDMLSVKKIISHFPPRTRSVVALGTPTVAAIAADDFPEVTLVDISQRFWKKEIPKWLDTGKVDRVMHDLDDKPYDGVTDADVVVMDPPWYIEHYRAWLWSAVKTCRPGGLIAVALPQLLTNRRALPEREEIMGWLRAIGCVSIEDGALTYVTPSFEVAVLEPNGLDFLRRWRRADLALVRLQNRALPYDMPRFSSSEWAYREILGRIVRSWREIPHHDIAPVIGPADPDLGYRLSGVGRNYLWSSDANLITSHGGAAVVTEWGVLPAILDSLETGEALSPAVARALPAASLAERESLIGTLRTILMR